MTDEVILAARRAMEQAKRDVIANLAGRGTGQMAKTVRYRVRPNVASVTVTLRVDDPGASFLDLGTSTPIRSTREGGRMAVFARTGGPIIYRTEVRGQPATRFFSKVADELPRRVQREMGRKA